MALVEGTRPPVGETRRGLCRSGRRSGLGGRSCGESAGPTIRKTAWVGREGEPGDSGVQGHELGTASAPHSHSRGSRRRSWRAWPWPSHAPGPGPGEAGPEPPVGAARLQAWWQPLSSKASGGAEPQALGPAPRAVAAASPSTTNLLANLRLELHREGHLVPGS